MPPSILCKSTTSDRSAAVGIKNLHGIPEPPDSDSQFVELFAARRVLNKTLPFANVFTLLANNFPDVRVAKLHFKRLCVKKRQKLRLKIGCSQFRKQRQHRLPRRFPFLFEVRNQRLHI